MARDHDRIRRDSAGVGPDPEMAGHLYHLSDANFKIADGEPDIRGWEVRTLAGQEVGEVDDLLIDPHRREVVMLDVDLNDSDRHANVPIRSVQIDRERKCVVVDSGDIERGQGRYRDDRLDDDAAPYRGDRSRDARDIDDRIMDDRDREVRYARPAADEDAEEVVVERRPVIEEVVVRRRVVESDEIEEP